MNTQKLRSLKPKEYFYNSVNCVYWHFYSIFSIFYLTSPNYMWFSSPSELKMFLSKLPIIIHMCCVALRLLHQLYLGNFAATIKFLKNLMNMFNNSELKMYIKNVSLNLWHNPYIWLCPACPFSDDNSVG